MTPLGRLVSSLALLTALGWLFPPTASAQTVRVRRAVRLPDIPGYRTLKCDFHTHTVFSDGSVWPDVRAEEAWREGLDAVAITDHIEYQPHADDLPTAHERSFEIARPHGDSLDLIVIRGSEVTRDMPPGHLNAVFLRSVGALDREEWRDAVEAAHAQGAFVFWNHPGWTGQQPDGIARWYPIHTELVEKGLLHGIEVVNSREYYPEAHRWCLEKNLTMLSNSDIHEPLNLGYDVHRGDHRPLTLVFATERSAEAIRDALFARRTAVYSGDLLVGREEHLRPIFERCVALVTPTVTARQDGTGYAQLRNDCELPFRLVARGTVDGFAVPKSLVLSAERTILVDIRPAAEAPTGPSRLTLAWTVDNVKVAPDQGLPVELPVEVRVLAKER